jgi:uncharacterized protein YjbI with pentapeptide repeats
LIKCDLSNASVRGFETIRVEFIGCRLTGMKAAECRWQDVLMKDCEASYAQFVDGGFKTCEFRDSQFPDADFRRADLEGTLFSGGSLRRADLTGAKLQDTDLRTINIAELVALAENLRGAIVTAAQAMDLARFLGVVIR